MSHLASSRTFLEYHGWSVEVVERHIPGAWISKDMFGMFDLFAMNGGPMILGVQVTYFSEIEDHVEKIRKAAEFKRWIESPFRKIIVHGWFTLGPRTGWKLKGCRVLKTPTGKIARWQVKEIEVR